MAVGKGRIAIHGWRGEGTEAAPAKNPGAPVPVPRATKDRNRGRQGAVNKKRGQNPVKETASMPANRPGTVEEKNLAG
ncbi:MAG: hypothetical protein A2139_11790 [Desulfobacca sp. RBG_16_60_12]|nr:MAG: hypothetical protein A2139_11790 [Desulfobacca sp. RBG_16_60_12]